MTDPRDLLGLVLTRHENARARLANVDVRKDPIRHAALVAEVAKLNDRIVELEAQVGGQSPPPRKDLDV